MTDLEQKILDSFAKSPHRWSKEEPRGRLPLDRFYRYYHRDTKTIVAFGYEQMYGYKSVISDQIGAYGDELESHIVGSHEFTQEVHKWSDVDMKTKAACALKERLEYAWTK